MRVFNWKYIINELCFENPGQKSGIFFCMYEEVNLDVCILDYQTNDMDKKTFEQFFDLFIKNQTIVSRQVFENYDSLDFQIDGNSIKIEGFGVITSNGYAYVVGKGIVLEKYFPDNVQREFCEAIIKISNNFPGELIEYKGEMSAFTVQ